MILETLDNMNSKNDTGVQTFYFYFKPRRRACISKELHFKKRGRNVRNSSVLLFLQGYREMKSLPRVYTEPAVQTRGKAIFRNAKVLTRGTIKPI